MGTKATNTEGENRHKAPVTWNQVWKINEKVKIINIQININILTK